MPGMGCWWQQPCSQQRSRSSRVFRKKVTKMKKQTDSHTQKRNQKACNTSGYEIQLFYRYKYIPCTLYAYMPCIYNYIWCCCFFICDFYLFGSGCLLKTRNKHQRMSEIRTALKLCLIQKKKKRFFTKRINYRPIFFSSLNQRKSI